MFQVVATLVVLVCNGAAAANRAEFDTMADLLEDITEAEELLSATTSSSNGCGAIERGSSVSGNDVGDKQIPGGSPSECCAACAAHSECHAAVWSGGSACYFKGKHWKTGYSSVAPYDFVLVVPTLPPKETCKETTVTDLGCWAEAWPMALPRLHPEGHFWRARSPEVCACLCMLNDPAHFNGLVSMGSDDSKDPGHCGCGDNWGGDPRATSYKVRGSLPDSCCAPFDEKTQTMRLDLVNERGENNGMCAQARSKRPYAEPYESQMPLLLKGKTFGTYNWRMRVFNVTLSDCPGKCDSRPVMHGQCPRHYSPPSNAKWNLYETCPNVVGGGPFMQHCSPSKITSTGASTSTTVRVGGRFPRLGDSFVEATFPPGGFRAQKCSGETLLDVLEQQLKDPAAAVFSAVDDATDVTYDASASTDHHHGSIFIEDAAAQNSPHRRLGGKAMTTGRGAMMAVKSSLDYSLRTRSLPEGTSAEAAKVLIANAVQWACENSALVAMKQTSCWTMDAEKDDDLPRGPLGIGDCTPPADSEKRGKIFTKPAEHMCGRSKDNMHMTMKESEAFVRDLTNDLATDIYATMRNSCPDLLELHSCLLPQLREYAYPWPAAESEPAHAMAIIIPFRGRPKELRKWVWWMLPILLRQAATAVRNGKSPQRFGVFIAVEDKAPLWNKARLNNAAVAEIRKLSTAFDCFVFADVDLVLQAPAAALDKGQCEIKCEAQFPVHFSTLLRGYSGPYSKITTGVFCNRGDPRCRAPAYRGGQSSGGVVGASLDQLHAFNGWPNSCWGWGNEDGVFDQRIKQKYGKYEAPSEWTVEEGNEECVWLHLTDKESEIKGQIVSREGDSSCSASGKATGLREVIDAEKKRGKGEKLYALKDVTHIGGKEHPLFTMMTLDLFND